MTAIIVNFKTLHLVAQAYESLCAAYSMPVVLIDNGSHDASEQWVRDHGGSVNKENIGHGPAMHQAINLTTTPYFLTIDTDCVVRRGGFLEAMLPFFAEEAATYAVGWLRWTNRESGIPMDWYSPQPEDRSIFVAYAHPVMALYSREKYATLKPFNHHGAPALQNMLDAEAHEYRIQDFPIFEYVTHLGAGTRRMFRGWWSPKSADVPDPWREDAIFPS